jgi:hypothetical protein
VNYINYKKGENQKPVRLSKPTQGATNSYDRVIAIMLEKAKNFWLPG